MSLSFSSLLNWVKSLGAGWWTEWRDEAEVDAKAAFKAILSALTPEAQSAIIAAEQVGIATFEASTKAGKSTGDAAVDARNAIEASVAASGQAIEADTLSLILEAVTAAVQKTATPAPAP